MNRRKKGTEYERRAAGWLREQGYEILETNFRGGGGDIDGIARDEAYLVFVEVKYRPNRDKGEGMEAVGAEKRRRIIRAARVYLMGRDRYGDLPCRFDVVSICGEEVTHLKNAFGLS